MWKEVSREVRTPKVLLKRGVRGHSHSHGHMQNLALLVSRYLSNVGQHMTYAFPRLEVNMLLYADTTQLSAQIMSLSGPCITVSSSSVWSVNLRRIHEAFRKTLCFGCGRSAFDCYRIRNHLSVR